MSSKLFCKIFLYSYLLFFISSCGTSYHGGFEKRKHLKGWHFQKNKNIEISSSDTKKGNKYESKKNIKKSSKEIYQSKAKNNLESNVSNVELVPTGNSSLNAENLAANKESSPNFNLSSDLSNDYKVNDNTKNGLENDNHELSELKKIDDLLSENQNNTLFNIENEHRSKWNFNGVFLLAFLFPLFFKGKKKREIQYWAARNKLKSQSLLVGLKVGAAGTAIGLGHMMQAPFSQSYLLASAAGIGISYCLWEYWKSQNELTSSKKMTLMSAVNTSTTFGFFTLGGMFSNSFDFSSWSISRGILDLEPTIVENSANGDTFITVSAIIFMTLALLILLYLILILSCRIYCSGSETFALLLAISLGYLLISLYIVFVLKKTVKEERENSWYFKRAFLFGIGGLVLYALASIFLFEYPEVSF